MAKVTEWVRGDKMRLGGVKSVAVWSDALTVPTEMPGYLKVAVFKLVGSRREVLSIWIPEGIVKAEGLSYYIGLVTETIRRDVVALLKNGDIYEWAIDRS